jgi:hypothetical protein
VSLLSKNHLTSQTDRPAPCRTSEADSSPCDVRSQRTPKGSRRLLDETFARLRFQELPFRVQKAASHFCRRECLRILTHSHTPQLLDREALHSLSVIGARSSRSLHAVNLLSKNHLTSQTDRPAPCRTSEADSSPCDVRSSARRKEVAACWTRRLHVSVSENSRFAFRKPLHVSVGESACASSPTATLHSFLTEKRCILFPSMARAPHAHNLR